jgi:ribosomal protein S27E
MADAIPVQFSSRPAGFYAQKPGTHTTPTDAKSSIEIVRCPSCDARVAIYDNQPDGKCLHCGVAIKTNL